MGAACVRFKTLEDLPLGVIGEAIRRVPPKQYIATCEGMLAGRASAKKTGAAKKAAAKKAPAKKAAAKSRAR